MKKRQRKKNAKKALKIMSAIIAITQAKAVLSQIRLNTNFYDGGIVPIKHIGEIVTPCLTNEFLINKDSEIYKNMIVSPHEIEGIK